MDISVYCRNQNRVDFDTFINSIADLDAVLLGENHVSEIHALNEEKMIKALQERRKIHLLTESYLGSEDWQVGKREMLQQFDFAHYVHVRADCEDSDNVEIADAICSAHADNALVLAIVGNWHLQGIHAVDAVVRRMRKNISIASIHQLSDAQPPAGIYSVRTIAKNDYALIGEV